jgi:hypothetical protein
LAAGRAPCQNQPLFSGKIYFPGPVTFCDRAIFAPKKEVSRELPNSPKGAIFHRLIKQFYTVFKQEKFARIFDKACLKALPPDKNPAIFRIFFGKQ